MYTSDALHRRTAHSFAALAGLACGASPLAGQLDTTQIRVRCEVIHPIKNQSIIYGNITDGRSGMPLPGSRVHLTWTTPTETGGELLNRVAADSGDGAYIFCDVPQRTRLTAWADALDMTSRRVAFFLEAGRIIHEDLDVRLRRATGSVSGILLDDSTEQPIGGATVRIPGTGASTLSNSNGTFRMGDVPVGLHEMVLGHVAYGEPTVSVTVLHAIGTHARIRLAPRAIALAPISVEISVRSGWLEENGFYARLESSLGAFVPPEEIDRHRYRNLAQVLRTIPAVNLRETCAPHCEVYIRMAGQTMSGCLPVFYIDGRRVHGLPYPIDLDMIVVGSDIAAVEVYRGISETPPQFYGRCGSIVIWTRRGAR